jgi:hypothetical protein
MSSKLSVEDIESSLEERVAFRREKEAFHAQQEVHHREQREFHAAELGKLLQSLDAFRAASATAMKLAQTVAPKTATKPAAAVVQLPPPGRLMAGRLVRLVAGSQDLAEPFRPTTVAAEVNRRFASHLPKPLSARTASDVLRRMAQAGEIHLVREGRPFHEALYARKARRGGS